MYLLQKHEAAIHPMSVHNTVLLSSHNTNSLYLYKDSMQSIYLLRMSVEIGGRIIARKFYKKPYSKTYINFVFEISCLQII